MSGERRGQERIDFFVGLIGQDATVRLFEAFGGQEIYIPQNPQGTTFAKLATAVGEDAAAVLCREFPAEEVRVPQAKMWRITIYDARGLATNRIARMVGLDTGTVRRRLNRSPAQHREAVRKMAPKRSGRA